MISFTIATFLKSFEDPFVLQEVQEIIQVLSENKFCIMTLQERLVPTLVRELQTFNFIQALINLLCNR